MMGYGYGMDWFSGLGMLLFSGLMVFGIVILLRWYSHQPERGVSPAGNNSGGGNQALEIARERLAKGEIKSEEFESIKRSLKT
jgi:putative membrane protein